MLLFWLVDIVLMERQMTNQRTAIKRSDISLLRKRFGEELQRASESEVMTSDDVLNAMWDDIVIALKSGITIPAIAEALSKSGALPKAASLAIMLRKRRAKSLEAAAAAHIGGRKQPKSATKATAKLKVSNEKATAESTIASKSKAAASGAEISDPIVHNPPPNYEHGKTKPGAAPSFFEEEK